MEKVYLASDVLVAYFRKPIAGELQRHKQATAVMEQVYAEELTICLTDITLFQVLKFLLEADESELAPEVYEAHRKYLNPHPVGRNAALWDRAWQYLLRLLRLPNVIVADIEQWKSTLFQINIRNRWKVQVHIEASYNGSFYALPHHGEMHHAQGIVSFEDQSVTSSVLPQNFPHIDPASF